MAGPNVQGGDRILGRQVLIQISGPSGLIDWGECDDFEPEDQSKTISNQPLGQARPRPQYVPGDWKLSFKGAMIDGTVDGIVTDAENAVEAYSEPPRYTVSETVYYYDGTAQAFTYPDVVLFGFKKSAAKADEAITWNFSGQCSQRLAGKRS